MSDPKIIQCGTQITEEAIDSWRELWVQEQRKNAIGRMGTSCMMRTAAINEICDLAKIAKRMERSSAKQSHKVAAAMLRQMANQLDAIPATEETQS